MADDLFNYAESVAAKRAAMQQVEDHAQPGWGDQMLDLVKVVCRTQRQFTADDVFVQAGALGIYNGTHDRRAFGPVMMRAAKAGWCAKAQCAPRNSARKTCHAGAMTVWDSLLFN
jgi:hypothetical protein